MYYCGKCGAKIDSLPVGLIRCNNCGHKILFKERPPVTIEVDAV
ncbi:MAG: DNA-directed RNA polymerase subunit P [archaeon]